MFEADIKNGEGIISIKAACPFWEDKKEEVILAYLGFKQGRWGEKTRVICILITKDNKDEQQYFLHIYY